MNLKEYMIEARKTRASLESEVKDAIHMLMGLQTELGELTDNFKRTYAYNADFDYVNLKEELGDMHWYWTGLCDIFELDQEDVLDANINKLRVRYPNKFNETNAVVRNLDKEKIAFTSDLEWTGDPFEEEHGYDYASDDLAFDVAREKERF
jgi:NTP pyrophosphatase (non-canonical NTP hydrolase)